MSKQKRLEAVNLFFCYAHQDERFQKELSGHLSILSKQGLIEEWNYRDIKAGQNWRDEVDTHLESAHIVLLLISPSFMNSDYCYSVEMTKALERHNNGMAKVIPILLRHVDITNAPFSKLQMLPKSGKPVKRWIDRDEAYKDIVLEIRKVICDILDRSDPVDELIDSLEEGNESSILPGLAIQSATSGDEHFYESGKMTSPPSSGNRRLIKIMTVSMAVLLISVIVLTMALITSHQPTLSLQRSTATRIVSPISTPGIATVGPSNIRLKCSCSDPVLVTITKIDIQPQQNRMLWSVTLQNVSPNNATVNFTQFYLQQGNLISNPTSGEQQYLATGGAANNAVSLLPSGQPGDTQTTTLTFLFMPYATSYTLTSILDPCLGFCDSVTFDPAVIQFS